MLDTIRSGRSLALRIAAVSALGLVPAMAAQGCSSDSGSNTADDDSTGSIGLAITSPDGETVRTVKYTVKNAAGEVVHNDTVNVADAKSTISVSFSLRAGSGYVINLVADSVQGSHCVGSATFAVVRGSVTRVELALSCTLGADGGTGEVVVNGTLTKACPRVLNETVSPLVASVGNAVNLGGAASSSDAVLTWAATSGTILNANAADTSLTCTAAGISTVTLTATRGAGCVDTKRVDVTCVPSLPSSLVLTDCQATRVCQVSQSGTSFKAVCDAGTTTLNGTLTGNTVQWNATDGAPCSGSFADGQITGTCQGADGGTCPVSTAAPLASAACLTVPAQILADGCGEAGARCDVVQNGCTWQASCADGKVFGGTATATGVRWTAADKSSCRSAVDATLPAGTVAGTCTPPTTNKTATACRFTLARPADLAADPVCTGLPATSVLEGCGLENLFGDKTGPAICRTIQNGCLWQETCDDFVLSGKATGATYGFKTGDGKTCSGTVTNGKLAGTCTSAAGTCAFAQRDAVAAPAQECQKVPPSITIDGCGVQGACTTIQDGCDWQATCNNAVTFSGISTPTGLALMSYIDDNAVWCTLDQAGSSLSGGCKPYPVQSNAPFACTITGTVAGN